MRRDGFLQTKICDALDNAEEFDKMVWRWFVAIKWAAVFRVHKEADLAGLGCTFDI